MKDNQEKSKGGLIATSYVVAAIAPIALVSAYMYLKDGSNSSIDSSKHKVKSAVNSTIDTAYDALKDTKDKVQSTLK